jgi:hypothetical protein
MTIIEPKAGTVGLDGGYISNEMFYWISDPLWQSIASILILFFDALLINRMVIKNHVSRENTLVAGMLFGLLASIVPSTLPLSSVLMCSPFVLLAIQGIFNSYNNLKASDEIFMSGFYISLAALLYFPIIYFFVFTFMSFMIMRSFDTKEKIQHLLGWLTPFLMVTMWEYFIGVKQYTLQSFFYNNFGLSHFLKGFSLNEALVLIIVLVFLLIFLLSYGVYSGRKIIASQKRISILYWALLFSGISATLYLKVSLDHILLFWIPGSIFFALNLLEYKNRLWPEIIHMFLILLLVILHFELIKL